MNNTDKTVHLGFNAFCMVGAWHEAIRFAGGLINAFPDEFADRVEAEAVVAACRYAFEGDTT